MILKTDVHADMLKPPCSVWQGGCVLNDLEHIALPSRLGLGERFFYLEVMDMKN